MFYDIFFCQGIEVPRLRYSVLAQDIPSPENNPLSKITTQHQRNAAKLQRNADNLKNENTGWSIKIGPVQNGLE